MGETALVNFFKEHKREFPEINGSEFDKNIRCRIIHQAQTQGGFRIIRTGPIFDSVAKSINATLFLRSLKQVVVRKALRKVKFICDASLTRWFSPKRRLLSGPPCCASIAPDAARIYERVGH